MIVDLSPPGSGNARRHHTGRLFVRPASVRNSIDGIACRINYVTPEIAAGRIDWEKTTIPERITAYAKVDQIKIEIVEVQSAFKVSRNMASAIAALQGPDYSINV